MERMSRLIQTENSIFSLHMKCYYISSDYREGGDLLKGGPAGQGYLKDIFD